MSFNARKILQPLSYPRPIEWQYPVGQLPISSAWNQVIFAAGKFVAVSSPIYTSSDCVPAYSYDGINWNQGNVIGGIMKSYCVAYGNGIFIALGPNPAYSSDGITWNLFSGPNSTSIIFGGGKFLASGPDGGQVSYSVNGTSWTAVALSDQFINAGGMAYGNGRFVVTSSSSTGDSNRAAYSNDGITWYNSTLPSSNRWGSVVYVNGKFVAVGSGTNFTPISPSAISNDGGVTWSGYGTINDNIYGYRSIIAVQDLLVTISAYGQKYAQRVINGGLPWYPITFASGDSRSIAYGNNRYVIVGFNTSSVLYSN